MNEIHCFCPFNPVYASRLLKWTDIKMYSSIGGGQGGFVAQLHVIQVERDFFHGA